MSTKTAAEIVAEVTLANYGPGADADLYALTQRDTETADPSTAQLLDSAALHRDLLGDGVRALMIAAIDADRAQRAPLIGAVGDALSDRYGDDDETVVWARDTENEQGLWDTYIGPMLDDIREEH